MKKIILNIIVSLLTTMCFAQSSDLPCTISYNYASNSGWNTDKHYFTINCTPALVFLPASTAQGNHSFISNQLQFSNIQDASMNRVFRSFTPLLGNTFIADFEARITNPGNTLVGYVLLALTQNDAAPLYDFSSNCAITQTANNAIIVSVQNTSGTSPMDVSIISKYATTATTTATGFSMSSNVTYYFRLRRESASKLTFEVFSDANRTNLIRRKSCIDIDYRITALSTIQHANNPVGGVSRITSGYIANVCINANPDITCCTPRITGNNTICEEVTPATYQVNAVAGNTYTWVLPSDVTYTSNSTNSQITITNWGLVNSIPKQIDIKVKMYCHCDSFVVTYPVFVYPKRDPSFNFQNIGNIGNVLSDFQAVGNTGVAGTINHWEIYECNSAGVIPSGAKPIRNVYWQTSAGPAISTFSIIADKNNLSTVGPYPSGLDVDFPWNDLRTGHFYSIKHGMYYSGSTCDWRGTSRVIYVGAQFKVTNLGDPQTKEYKINLDQLKKTEKIMN